jgi:hypothetical protein
VLFSYPVEAASANWLHECLANVVREGMDDIDARRPRVIWPDCIAAEWRERLRSFTQLEERLTALMLSYEALDGTAKLVVRRAMDGQAALEELFDGQRAADRLDNLLASVRGSLKLFLRERFKCFSRWALETRTIGNSWKSYRIVYALYVVANTFL